MEPILLDKPPVDVILTWETIVAPGVDRYRVRRELPDGGGWEILGDTTAPPFIARGIVADSTVRFAVSPVFTDGTEPPEEAWETAIIVPSVAADSFARPAAVAGFVVAQDAGYLRFGWTPPNDGVTREVEVRVVISASPAWEGCLLVARVPAISGSVAWPWLRSGSQTFLARGVDGLGRYSIADASVTFNVVDAPDHLTIETEDEDGDGFTGTKAAVEVDGDGDLVLEALPATGADWTETGASYTYPPLGTFKRTGTYETAPVDHGQVETCRIEATIAGENPSGPGTLSFSQVPGRRWKMIPHGLIDNVDGIPYRRGRRLILDRYLGNGRPLYGVDLSVEISISETNTGTLGSVVWGPWVRFVPGDFRCRWHRFRVTLRGDGFSSPKISGLRFRRRRRNRKDEGTVSVTLDPGPTSIAFVTPFTVAPEIVAFPVGTNDELKVNATSVTAAGANLRVYAKERAIEVALDAVDFSDPGMTKQVLLYSLPAGWEVVDAYVKHGTQFAGPGFTAVRVGVGLSTAGLEEDLLYGLDVLQAPAGGLFAKASPFRLYSASGATSIYATATSEGASLDQLAAGDLVVRIKVRAVTTDAMQEVFTGSIRWHAMGT